MSGYRGGIVTAPDVLAAVEAMLCEHFAQLPQRASMSFVGVEPIEILRFEPIPGERCYVSLGMSRHPMTAADATVKTASGPRAELMLHIRDPDPPDLWRQLAVLAAAPAVESVVYGPGLSIDLGTPLAAGSRCTGGIAAESIVGPAETADGAVDILRILPATNTELAWSRVHGSAALRERWDGAHTDLLDLGRAAVDLSA